MGDKLLAMIEEAADEEMSKYVSYDGPAERDLVRLMSFAAIAGLKEAAQIARHEWSADSPSGEVSYDQGAADTAWNIDCAITARIKELEGQ